MRICTSSFYPTQIIFIPQGEEEVLPQISDKFLPDDIKQTRSKPPKTKRPKQTAEVGSCLQFGPKLTLSPNPDTLNSQQYPISRSDSDPNLDPDLNLHVNPPPCLSLVLTPVSTLI